ncbi:hypothetical protein TUMEXPCC7403_18310 [Tumidithrix helvetica PCC 7403]|uniref:hypothetical protein n=1 Tax=Tumidithrix helvetica TaxID=3457545 RepID=UPI003C9CC37A
MNKLDLWAKIVPGTSAAGFKIGDHLSAIPDLKDPSLIIDQKEENEKRKRGIESIGLNDVLINSKSWICHKLSSNSKLLDQHKVFYYGDRIVMLEFNSNDILFMIFVFEGYKGKFLDKFEIGSKLSDLTEYFELDYDSGDELNYPSEASDSDFKGIGFYGAEQPLENNPNQQIVGFCVHNWKLQA